ncbi:hypothetical protein ACIBCH_37350 [Amycolatopsis thailandensis]|uniref:hypothetical protein n=1 Tax=Amycolatopsis thailandensis TaxID=589330 RepID=UPI00379F9E75
MDHSLDALRGRLLIQCRSTRVASILDIAEQTGAGLVLTGTSPEDTVRSLRAQGFDGPILCDADRYSGKRRISAGRGTHPAWVRHQRELGLLPLTDSGYLAPRNWTGLKAILQAAGREPAPVVAVLPMSTRWFVTASICEAVAREINRYGVPVALVLEHQADPFGIQYLLKGLLQLLAVSTVPVLLLRSDVSSIGALCHGAHAAAVGTIGALRHLYPVTTSGPRRPIGVSAFVTRLLSYHRLETCEEVFADTPDIAHLWTCGCPVCGGAPPDQLTASENPGVAAARHSLYCLLQLHAELFRRLRTRDQLISSWHETCSHALYVHDQVAETAYNWRKPANLRVWNAITEDPLPHRAGIPGQTAEPGPKLSRPRRRGAPAPLRESGR